MGKIVNEGMGNIISTSDWLQTADLPVKFKAIV